MFIKKSILNVVAGVVTIVNAANADAAHTRGMRAESLESLVSTTSTIKDEISSRIKAAFLDDVVSFTQSSSSPTHDSMDGCVQAKDNLELSIYISNAQNIGDGQVRLCPGTIHFYDKIVLDDSITLSCSGPRGSCILDGHEATRHFLSNTADLTFTFIDLVLINGLADDSSTPGPLGGSLFLRGSTNIIEGSLFYNNRVTSSTGSAFGGAIFAEFGETVVNNCLFLENAAVTTNAGSSARGGAIDSSVSKLTVVDSIFKNNRAIQADTTSGFGGGGGIYSLVGDVLVLSSLFELNEASNIGGAALFEAVSSVAWYNNKELLLGNDALDCDGANVAGEDCFSVGDNFSF